MARVRRGAAGRGRGPGRARPHRGRRRARVRGRAVHHRGPRRPGAGRLRGLRRAARRRSRTTPHRPEVAQAIAVGPRRPTSGAAPPWATTCCTSRSPSGAAGGCSACRGSRVRSCGVEQEVARLRRSIAWALAVAFLLTAVLALALSASLAGPLRADHGLRAPLRRRRPRPRASRVDRADEMGELARILNHSADQLQARLTEVARERARADAILSAMDDGLLAVDHQGTVLLANESLCRGLSPAPIPRAATTWRRCASARSAALVEEVLRTGRAARGRGRRAPPAARVRAGRRALPGHGGRARTARCSPSTTSPTAGAWSRSAATSWPTPPTSCARRSPRSAGSWRRWRTARWTSPRTRQRFLGKIRVHAERMAALVADLLELSRLESGERPPRWERVAPMEIVEDVVASLGSLAASKQVDALRPRRGRAATSRRTPSGCAGSSRTSWRTRSSTRRRGARSRSTAHGRRAASAVVVVQDDGPGIAAEHLPADLRALLPRGQGAQPRARRHGPGPRHRAPPGGEHRRAGDRVERGRRGHALHRDRARRATKSALAATRKRHTVVIGLSRKRCVYARGLHRQVVHAQGGAVPRAPGQGHPEPRQGGPALRGGRGQHEAWTSAGRRRTSSRPSSTTAT